MTAKVFDFRNRSVRTREMKEGKCNACGHKWIAPAIGKCPVMKCGSDQTVETNRRHCDAPRVR